MTTPLGGTTEKHEVRHGAYGDETRRAIVLAAIRVVAESGVNGASLRAINVAAGSKNSSAAHYHFGTKLAMLEAAVALVWGEVLPAQNAGLEALEARMAAGGAVSAREILETTYLPYLALLQRDDFGTEAAKFVSRLLVESDAEIQGLVNRTVAPQMGRVLGLLLHALPEVPPDKLVIRLFITVTNVIHGAGDINALTNSPLGDLTAGDRNRFAEVLMDYLTAAVSAP
jgi:AcrR family transcriptional regulator